MELQCFDVTFSDGISVEVADAQSDTEVQVWYDPAVRLGKQKVQLSWGLESHCCCVTDPFRCKAKLQAPWHRVYVGLY